nr:NUDIX hydrolase [Desulfolucanica intricata]
MSDLIEKTIDSKVIYQGKILNLRLDTVTLPNGNTGAREIVEHSGAVAIVAITDDQKVVLVKQYRHPVGEVLLELPAGKLESGENPLQCARRELKEETGWEAAEWIELTTFYTSPGFSNEKMYLYLAKNLSYTGQKLDEDEFVQVILMTLDDAVQRVLSGEIHDSKSIAGILAAKIINK